jgi:hypothetical protein
MAKLVQELSDRYVVETEEGDSLWSVAQKFLGSGSRWPELVSSNPGDDLAKHAYVKSGARLNIPRKSNGAPDHA